MWNCSSRETSGVGLGNVFIKMTMEITQCRVCVEKTVWEERKMKADNS